MNYQLKSKIPGVEVFLTPDPLNAKIILSEGAKREFALTLAIEEMTDAIYMAYHYSTTNKLDKTSQELKRWNDSWFSDESDEYELSSADRWLKDSRVIMWFKEIDSSHLGDCTAFACSCTRCFVERILGIDTLPSYSKYINNYMNDLYLSDVNQSAEKSTNNLILEKAKEIYKEHKRLYQEQQNSKIQGI